LLDKVRSHGAPENGSFFILSALFQIINDEVVMFRKPLMVLLSVKNGIRVFWVADSIIVYVHDWVCVVGHELALRNLPRLII
jgi:hypothetical protein